MELYIILATLENVEHWNEIVLIIKWHHLKRNREKQCSPAMVGFLYDKINIVQYIKCLFNGIALAPGVLDVMNKVIWINKNSLGPIYQKCHCPGDLFNHPNAILRTRDWSYFLLKEFQQIYFRYRNVYFSHSTNKS